MRKQIIVAILSLTIVPLFLYGWGKLLERETTAGKPSVRDLLKSLQQPEKPKVKAPIPHWKPEEKETLQPIAGEKVKEPNLGLDEQIWGETGDRAELLKAIDRSLQYLNSEAAVAAYKNYPVEGITRDRVQKSLQRFRELAVASQSPEQLQEQVKREFTFYQSVGRDRKGDVLFSAYFEPIYPASRQRTEEYRYPIYRSPSGLASWKRPHPTRKELEGEDGLKTHPKLKGSELFWLRDRWQAYTIHIQGSARLQLTDGTETTVGYAGNTRQDYTSIGWELAEDGKLPLEAITMPLIREYFAQNPQELNDYLTRDRSFVFFSENRGKPASGSIGVTLAPERAIATDKSLMPPGALALIHTTLPFPGANGTMEEQTISRYVLDQDAGGAIKGAGRVDYFLGAGKIAEERAGVTRSQGQLYYLLLDEKS
ncbi:murein transglycosylase A [Lusitaniella coriacea]|uniref:murein transglycosylase A n=1 Tax=Lusitaniella coriacea TaxID=1983105 RepID=UPI003CE712A5